MERTKTQKEFEEFYLGHSQINEGHLTRNREHGGYFYTDTQIMYKLWTKLKMLENFMDNSVASL